MNSTHPIFSIIIPVFNAGCYLVDCLNALARQTVKSFECICVDDGSTDASGGILDEFARRDARFVVVHQENAGVSAARNRALRLVQGQYVGFVDGDDVIDSHWLEAAQDAFALSGADMVKMRLRREEKEDEDYLKPEVVAVFSNTNLWAWSCLRGGLTVQNFYRREVLADVRFPVGMRIYEDGVFNLHALLNVRTGAQSEFDGYWYRFSDSSSFKRAVTEAEYCRLIDELGSWYQNARSQLQKLDALEVVHANLVRYINAVTSNWFARGPFFSGGRGRLLAEGLRSCGRYYGIALCKGAVLRWACLSIFTLGVSKVPFAVYVRWQRRRDRARAESVRRAPITGEGGESRGMMVAYAAWHVNSAVRQKCTSGGVATALAEATIVAGGIVVGAAYADDMSVRHVIVNDLDGLRRVRGVKYVHSLIGREIYDGIAEALMAGRRVLFVGLPCQTAAIRKRFGNDANLLLVDLICFGAPPQLLWQKYIAWLGEMSRSKVAYVDPRDKKHGWGRKTYYRYEWADGRVGRKCSLYDPYSQAFYSAIAFRPCCYACRFRGDGHVSDMTVCDFRGVEELRLDRKITLGGVSGVLCRAQKAVVGLQAASLRLVEASAALIISNNASYASSPKESETSHRFAVDLLQLSFASLVEKYGLAVDRTAEFRARVGRVVRKVFMASLTMVSLLTHGAVFPVADGQLQDVLKSASYFKGAAVLSSDYLAELPLVLSGEAMLDGANRTLRVAGIKDNDFITITDDASWVIQDIVMRMTGGTNVCAIAATGDFTLTNVTMVGFDAGEIRVYVDGVAQIGPGSLVPNICIFENARLCLAGGHVSNCVARGSSKIVISSGTLDHISLYDDAQLVVGRDGEIEELAISGLNNAVDIRDKDFDGAGYLIKMPRAGSSYASVFEIPDWACAKRSHNGDRTLFTFAVDKTNVKAPEFCSDGAICVADSGVKVRIRNAIQGVEYVLMGAEGLSVSATWNMVDIRSPGNSGILELNSPGKRHRFFKVVARRDME